MLSGKQAVAAVEPLDVTSRVLVAVTEPRVRERLLALLRDTHELHVACELQPGGRELAVQLDELRPDIAVVDPREVAVVVSRPVRIHSIAMLGEDRDRDRGWEH